MYPGQRVAEDDQRRARQDVPGVEECQPAQDQCRDEEACFVEMKPAKEQVNGAAPAAQEDMERHGNGQQVERYGQHMRVQVSQQIGKEGKLVDDLETVAVQVIILQHARGAPPPEEFVRSPFQRQGGGIAQHLQIQPSPKWRGCRAIGIEHPADALAVQGLEKAVQVADDKQKERSQQSAQRRQDPFLRFLYLRALERRQQVIQQSIRPNRAQGKDQRQHQVVRYRPRRGRQLGQHGGHHIPEVIIRDGIAREPRVMRRKCG